MHELAELRLADPLRSLAFEQALELDERSKLRPGEPEVPLAELAGEANPGSIDDSQRVGDALRTVADHLRSSVRGNLRVG
jgi:hypothetical protein